jgi:phosphoglycerate kinase
LDLIKKAEAKSVNIHLPSDSVIADKFAADAQTSAAPSNNIPEGWMGLDIGPMACEQFCNVIMHSRTILWNGPMGVFEMDNFAKGTEAIANELALITRSGTTTIVGGGDSAAALTKLGLQNAVSHVSTGGGASLEFLEGKILPGVAALTAR